MNKRVVALLTSHLLFLVAAPMLLPMILAIVDRQLRSAVAYGASAVATALTAGVLRYIGRKAPNVLHRKDALGVVALTWICLGVFGAVPFLLEGSIRHPASAVFEAVSGFTTTGATVVGDVDGLSRATNLWRCMIHWIGGMGIVVLFVAVFPNIGVSGKNMFKSEVPGVTEEGLRPRIAETSIALWRLYLGLTVACVVAMWFVGLGAHDAVVHGLATLSTGGFSSRDASIAAFANPALDWVTAVFMVLAGVNFGLYYGVVRAGSLGVLLRSFELRVYSAVVVLGTVALTWLLLPQHDGVWTSLRYAFFRVATSLTSTGFGLDDHATYTPGARLILLGMMFVGGCAGSTAGGMKVSRIIILFETAVAQVRRSIRPGVVRIVRVDGRPVPPEILLEVSSFFFIFLASMAIIVAGVVMADGVSTLTAFGATLSALSNMGPAPWYVDADNYARYTATSKLLFSFAMVLGRLEFFTVLAIFAPEVWRRRQGRARRAP